MNGSAFEALGELLVTSPAMLARIRLDHVPDADGRCRTCRQGPTGAARTVRCTTWAAVQEALRRTTGAEVRAGGRPAR